MKRIPTNKPTRRYHIACCQLKWYLLYQINHAYWLHPKTINELTKDLLNIDILDGAIEQLWEVACCLAESMVDCEVDDEIFYTFVRTSMAIRSRGDENV